MKSKYSLITGLSLFVFGLIITHNFTFKPQEKKPFDTSVDSVDTTKSISTPPKKVVIKKPTNRGDLYTFMKRLGRAEGLGSYSTVSRTGYLGLYQFHPKTLRSLGFNVSTDQFLTNPALQDSAMIAYMRMNARELSSTIKKFNGTTVNGVYITKAGILAGAHLMGSAGVLAFFYPERYAYKTVDGNGVHISQYMTKFAGYDLRGL